VLSLAAKQVKEGEEVLIFLTFPSINSVFLLCPAVNLHKPCRNSVYLANWLKASTMLRSIREKYRCRKSTAIWVSLHDLRKKKSGKIIKAQ